MKTVLLRASAALVILFPWAIAKAEGRLAMFIGVDVSGSYLKGRNFDDSLDFLAHYIYAHLHGLDGTEKPGHLFVGSLGGNKSEEPKTFYPIETFENEDSEGIKAKLKNIFPQGKSNLFTDYNAFFSQIANHVRNRKLVLKPLNIVVLSDGRPDLPGKEKSLEAFRKIDFEPLERLSRNITLRLLYTDAITAEQWQTKVPRRRLKIWTQDAAVMQGWKDQKIFIPNSPLEKQKKFLSWLKSNVDFNVPARRVE